MIEPVPNGRRTFGRAVLCLLIILFVSSGTFTTVNASGKVRKGAKTRVQKPKIAKTANERQTQIADKGEAFDEAIGNSLADAYLSGKKNNSTSADPTGAKNYYNSLNSRGKNAMLDFYSDKIGNYLEKEKKDEALTLIDLYHALAAKNDEKLPTMLLIKGTLHAEQLDSVNVSQTIKELEACNPQKTEFITALKEHLEKIKNYEPPLRRTGNSIWVAGNTVWDDPYAFGNMLGNSITKTQTINMDTSPTIFMSSKYDATSDTASFIIDPVSSIKQFIDWRVLGVSGMLFDFKGLNLNSKLSDMTSIQKPISSQIVIQTASDSIYILWSSEHINRNSPEIASILRGCFSSAASSISAEFAQRNVHSFGTHVGVSLLLIPAEILFNAIIDELFTPTKKMYTLEAYLKCIDQFTMTGEIVFNFNKITAKGDFERKKTKCHVVFSKWTPESGIVFESPIKDHKLFLHPSLDISPQEYKKDKTTRYAHWKQHGDNKNYSNWNNDQYKWLVLYNDSVLKSNGIESHIIDKEIPSVGLDVVDIPEKVQSKQKLSIGMGVYVENVKKTSASGIAGIKKKDIILEVNGENLTSSAHFSRIISNSKPGDWLYCKVLRGKKYINVPIRVTWDSKNTY